MPKGNHSNRRRGPEHYRCSEDRMISEDGYVKLTYDWGDATGEPPGPGCYLRGQGVRGPSPRAYLIHSARLVKSVIHPNRWALTCERLLAADIPAGAPVYSIHWYSRARKQRTKYRSVA